ncbi:hypothetical protein PoB_003196300 [Plakobranchus ocellatus]|uniref:Uncharacterized protein n=1 Tax=Plakobranchus ocellatus TaxID=259542 RepID=A0AAV4AFY4_9GAST|nr:hypothetical protein PoB_003196300 [Plakobranchus ocellatus]
MRGHVIAPPFPLSDRATDVRPGCKTQRIAPTLRQVADLMCARIKEREYFKTCIVRHAPRAVCDNIIKCIGCLTGGVIDSASSTTQLRSSFRDTFSFSGSCAGVGKTVASFTYGAVKDSSWPAHLPTHPRSNSTGFQSLTDLYRVLANPGQWQNWDHKQSLKGERQTTPARRTQLRLRENMVAQLTRQPLSHHN